MLAHALAQQPKVLMFDEPTSNLDLKNHYEVLRFVRDIAIEDSICVIIVIHDLNLALRYCDRFLFIKDSNVFSYGGLETMTPENIEEVYRMHVLIIDYMGIPLIVPFPNEMVIVQATVEKAKEPANEISVELKRNELVTLAI